MNLNCHMYRFVRRSPDVAGERTPNLWTRIKLRKPFTCCICTRPIQKGSLVWRPLSENGDTVRNERICEWCFGERIVEDFT